MRKLDLLSYLPLPLADSAFNFVQVTVRARCPMMVHIAPDLPTSAVATGNLGPWLAQSPWALGSCAHLWQHGLCRLMLGYTAGAHG